MFDEAGANASFRGFPLVRSCADRIFLGYLPLEQGRRVLTEKLSSGQAVAKTPVLFTEFVQTAGALGEEHLKRFVDLSDIIDSTVMRLVPETPMSMVHNVFFQLGLRMVVVVSRGKLQGIITKKDFVESL